MKMKRRGIVNLKIGKRQEERGLKGSIGARKRRLKVLSKKKKRGNVFRKKIEKKKKKRSLSLRVYFLEKEEGNPCI